jgi:DNA-binding transcriptional LysR family regulator
VTLPLEPFRPRALAFKVARGRSGEDRGMDRFESMSAFVAVVEAGSFTAASRSLGVPLASLSRKVSDLETQLGVQLLDRSARKITLSDRGRQFFDSARRILNNLSEAERKASAEYRAPLGELVLAAPIVLGHLYVVPVVAEFLKDHRDVEVEVQLLNRRINLVEQDIEARIDVGMWIGELPDSNLIAVRVGGSTQVVCAGPDYLAKHGRPQTPEDLAAHECITLIRPPAGEWQFKDGNTVKAVSVRGRLKVTTGEAAVEAVIAAGGITRVYYHHAQQAIETGRLVPILQEYQPDPAPISLLYRAGRVVPLKLRAFLDFSVPRFRARLQGLTQPAA